MQISYTPEQEQLRADLRAYFAGLMTSDLRDALASTSGEYGDGAAYKQVVRQLRSEERRVGKECRSRWSPYH